MKKLIAALIAVAMFFSSTYFAYGQETQCVTKLNDKQTEITSGECEEEDDDGEVFIILGGLLIVLLLAGTYSGSGSHGYLTEDTEKEDSFWDNVHPYVVQDENDEYSSGFRYVWEF